MNKQNFTLDEIERQIEALEQENRSFFSLFTGFLKTMIQIAILPALVYLVFAFFLGIAQINQNSMLPNFAEGDFVIFNRIEENYSFGDVIVVQSVDEQANVVKRIIAVPGDTIEITSDLRILVNGHEIRETWQSTGTLSQGVASLSFKLDQDEYFVLNDNRDDSSDSRSKKYGNIEQEDILGIVVYRFKMSK
jgi:signal peptidase I